jgi:peptidoglycan/LPS O-acetylase OafA/YrhL
VAGRSMENGALAPARPQRFYRPELDAMRFFAFLCVFFHHGLSRANVGELISPPLFRDFFADSLKYAVSLFFLLSGYLITTLLRIEQESIGKLDLRAFYGRRIARIWPLYYSFLVIVLLVAIAVPRESPVSGALLAFLFFSGNWFVYVAGGLTGGLGILWSVNVEEQFYLFWPILIRFGRGRQGTLIPAVILICSYILLIVYGILRLNSDVVLRFNTLIEMQFFAAGGILAIWLPRAGLKIPLPLRSMLVLSGLSSWIAANCWLSIFGKTEIRTIQMWWAPAALYGCVLIGCVALFLGFFGLPRRWLPTPLLWLGKISYGLYLYHSLVRTLMPRWQSGKYGAIRLGLELLITILISGVSYHWLEAPFLRWKGRITLVPNRPA